MAQQATVRRFRAVVSIVHVVVRLKNNLSNHSSSDSTPNKNPGSSHASPCTRDMFVHLKRRKRNVVVLHIYRLCLELILVS